MTSTAGNQVICPYCGNRFERRNSHDRRTYCSKSCSSSSLWAEGGIFDRRRRKPGTKVGESFNSATGRWTVFVTGRGNVYRYRWVMEQHLGRELRSDEHVHHKNGDPTDDRISNLELLDIVEHGKLHSAESAALLPKRLKNGWSFEYERCVECGTDERKHVGHGECSRCYFRNRRRRERAQRKVPA